MPRKLKSTLLLSLFAVAGLLSVVSGCEKKSEPQKTPAGGMGTAQAATIELCTHCGQIKGSPDCCKPGAEKCAKCGLAKGSPGCCKIPKDAAKVELCTKCGQIAGSEECCKPGAVKCEKMRSGQRLPRVLQTAQVNYYGLSPVAFRIQASLARCLLSLAFQCTF